MTTPSHEPSLAYANLIGILGATAGDLNHLIRATDTLWKRGVGTVLVLGDFGFVWPGEAHAVDLDALSIQLDAKQQTLYFVDGNHEDFAALDTIPLSDDGLRWVRPNIAHIPRGYRTPLASGALFTALGGANSIDKHHRVEGRTWWPQESITEDDLAALGQEPVDILVGHDAPTPLPSLETALADTGQTLPEEMRAYARTGRQQFHRGFLQVRPKLYLGGHYPVAIDETVRYGDGADAFKTRVMLLSSTRSTQSSQGILDVHDREMKVFQRDDATVTELTGREIGRWKVQTLSSRYVFDFAARTVTRHPGAMATKSVNDLTRPLRRIEQCRVGQSGAWTMRSDRGYYDPVDFYWQVSTEIRSIERVSDSDA